MLIEDSRKWLAHNGLDLHNETTSPEVIAHKPEDKSKTKAKSKSIAEPIAEPVVKPITLERIKMTLRKPSSKQPKPVSRYTVTEPDIEDLEIKQMKQCKMPKTWRKMRKHTV